MGVKAGLSSLGRNYWPKPTAADILVVIFEVSLCPKPKVNTATDWLDT
jgi:hypothetical protein